MKRIKTTPRHDKAQKLESIGLSFHNWDDYWKEDAYYSFTLAQIEEIESATEELHHMCKEAVAKAIKEKRLGDFGIPEQFWSAIAKSFQNDFSIYGRFDLAYDGINPPKLLEYNADTPTSLLESAVAQWYWLEDKFPALDQFNSLHEKLIDRWSVLTPRHIHVATLKGNEEDWVCGAYMMDTIVSAGHECTMIDIEDIGYHHDGGYFVDLQNNKMTDVFKLYPWEWMMADAFGEYQANANWYEPIWKSVLSNKRILALLWEMFPGHKNLLPAYTSPNGMTNYVVKPYLSREGANIKIINAGEETDASDGPYQTDHLIYQEAYDMICFDGKYPVIGSWVVGDEPAGMCIREDVKRITTNMSNFVPHVIDG